MIFRVEGYRLTAATGSGVPHFKNCPCPLRGAGSPSRTTTTPREIVMIGQPRTVMPSYGV